MMKTVSLDSDLKRLFIYNRSLWDVETYAQILEIERHWIVRRVSTVEMNAPTFSSRAELIATLKDLLNQEEENPPESTTFLAQEASLDQFKLIVAEFDRRPHGGTVFLSNHRSASTQVAYGRLSRSGRRVWLWQRGAVSFSAVSQLVN
jgi:hypothetical protein